MSVEGGSGWTGHGDGSDVGDASNVLFLVPGTTDAGGCLDILEPEAPAESRVLAVTYAGSADGWLSRWREQVGVRPADVSVVNVGGAARSAAASADDGGSDAPVDVVESPEDLTGLGIRLGQQLSTWAAADDAPVVVCFDSLTALLQYADLRRAYRFLHVLAGRVAEQGGHAHYHLDPTATDDRTVTTLTTLFDAVVRYEDGDWSVRTR